VEDKISSMYAVSVMEKVFLEEDVIVLVINMMTVVSVEVQVNLKVTVTVTEHFQIVMVYVEEQMELMNVEFVKA